MSVSARRKAPHSDQTGWPTTTNHVVNKRTACGPQSIIGARTTAIYELLQTYLACYEDIELAYLPSF